MAVEKFGATPVKIDAPKPSPGPGEVLVHVGTAGVNPFDIKIANGAMDGRWPHVFPLVLGVDGSGVVEEVGPGVQRLKVGDGVYGSFLHNPVGKGTYAEYVAAPESNAIAVRPRGMYNDPAAAVPTPGMTALQSLDELGLRKRQTLLVIGASGGVGSFAVQLAANQGITVLGASRGAANRDYVLKSGARNYFDLESKTFSDDVRAAYPDGVDAILDVFHSPTEVESLVPLVAKGGTIASTVGGAQGPRLDAAGLRALNIDMKPKLELLDRLSSEYTQGRLRIPLEQKLPLESASDAWDAVKTGRVRGKIVLVV